MIRPLYRWKSFWFGVLVIGFFCWAWVRSMSQTSTGAWTTGDGLTQLEITNTNAEVVFVRGYQGISHGLFFAEAGLTPNENLWFPAYLEFWSDERVGFVDIAHWFLILLFLVPWSGWLAWRRRRIKRGC